MSKNIINKTLSLVIDIYQSLIKHFMKQQRWIELTVANSNYLSNYSIEIIEMFIEVRQGYGS